MLKNHFPNKSSNTQQLRILLLLAFFFSTTCYAKLQDQNLIDASFDAKLSANEISWIKKHPKVIVAGSSDWVPFDFVDKHGDHSGIANEYLNLIAKKTGLEFDLYIDQWGKNLQKIHNRQVDVLSAVFYTKERSEYLLYSSPYFEALDYFFVRDDLDVSTLEDLNGKRVAMAKGFANVQLVKKHFPNIRIVTVNSFVESIEAVLENRADMLYDSYAALTHALRKKGINSIVPFKSTRVFGANPIHFVSRKDQPELASIIQKGLNAISYPEKQAIYNRWIGIGSGTGISSNKHVLKLNQQEKTWLDQHQVIRLGTEENWPPFEFIDKSGQQQGMSADIIRLIEQRLGISFQLITPTNWSETYAKLNQHDIDIVGSIVKSKEREKKLSFSQAYISPAIVIYTRKDNQTIKRLDDLNGKTVSIEKDYYVYDRLTNEYPNISLEPFATTKQALQAVSFGKVDAYVGIQGPANSLIEQNALTNLKIAGESGLGNAELRFALRNDWPIFLGIINKVLDTISESEMLALRRKWLGISAAQHTFKLTSAEQKWLKKQKTIRFAGDPNWLPYEAFDQQGNYIGIVPEYLKLIEQRLGIDIEVIQTDSWQESIAKVKQGDIDVLSETIDSTLNQQLQFSQAYLSSPIVIIMKDNQPYVENLSQIYEKKIAVIKEYGYVPNIIKQYPGIDFYTADNIQEGLTKVSTGKVDALLATLAQASYHISEIGINNIRIVGKTEFNTQLAFGMRKDFAPLTSLFNKALNNITPAEKKNIQTIWGKPKYAPKTDYSLITKIAAGLILLNLLFYYWNRKLKIEVQKRKASEEKIRHLNQRIELATKLVSLGVWQWNLDTAQECIFNDQMFELYEIPKKNTIAHADWMHKVHPDDHQLLENSVDTLKKSGGQQHLEFRILRSDGSTRYIYSGVTIVNDKLTGDRSLYGVNWDITERKQAETQFRSIIETLPLAVVITNNHGEILLENPHAINELGNNKSIIGRNAAEFYENSEENHGVLKDLIKQRKMSERQVKYKTESGRVIDCLLSVLPIKYEHQDVWLVVIINLSERIKIEKHLAEAKDQAEKANRAKSEFLANMSHEIRTPMNAIMGFTELLGQQVEDQRHKAYVNTIHSAGKTLLTLINDILDLSKIEAGKLEIEKQATNPHELFSEMGNIFMINIHDKNLQLIVEIDPNLPDSLMLDGTRLRQVLFNLIGNAVKFTKHGYVKLKASASLQKQIRSKLDLIIEIEDTGVGIPEQQLENIFTAFTQSYDHDHLKYTGTGLGLSISRRLTELMGGHISVTSHLGEGSTFRIVLENIDVAAINIKALHQQEETSPNDVNFSPATVLVVDDVANNRELICANLADTELAVLQAEHGKQALELAAEQTIDVVLMDIRMPIMDGYEAAEQIKSSHNIPIIALTASVMKDDHEQNKLKDFDCYLQKPVLRRDLIDALKRFLKFQIIKDNGARHSPLILTEKQQETLPNVLNGLTQLTQQWQAVVENNNISEIKRFSTSLNEIAKNLEFEPLLDYAKQLDASVRVFDIQGIKNQLNNFTRLHNALIDLSLKN